MKKIIKFVIIACNLFFMTNFSLAAPAYMQIDLEPFKGMDFKIIDPIGTITGYDPVTGYIRETAHGNYGSQTVSSDLTGEVISETNEFISINPPAGLYKIVCYGGSITPYSFETHVSWGSASTHRVVTSQGLADIGKVDTYEFIITDVPMAAISITRVSSPNSLLSDISAAGKLGYLGNAEFVIELIKEVQKIEKERLHPEESAEHDPATPAQRVIKKYKKLLNEITETCRKPEQDEFVKQEAYTVLKEDIEYIIAHIQ